MNIIFKLMLSALFLEKIPSSLFCQNLSLVTLNNVIEYQPLILGLEMAIDMKQLHLQVFGWLGDVTLQHVCRTENKKVYALPALASTLTLPVQTQVTICQIWIVAPPNEEKCIENELIILSPFLKSQRKIRDNPLLTTCVMGYFQKIQREVLTFVVVHLASFTTRMHYIEDHLRVYYYGVWERKKQFKICEKHTQELCSEVQCLSISCKFHTSAALLYPTIASWPFDAWGLDVVGPLPKSSGGHLYILATTNYFSKWAEAVALKEVKKENVANFVRVNIIYHFGIPHNIITDNGKPFDNKLMKKICDLFGFKQRKSSMYHTAANGLGEAFNKTLCNLLKKSCLQVQTGLA
ncbi:hypothetical protein KY289_003663 [Solanum tuberosum]|nr:hypothetical protein KY289_003663 [Solanum tuberosum]